RSEEGRKSADVIQEHASGFLTALDLLGFLDLLEARADAAQEGTVDLSSLETALAAAREAAMASKDFSEVDRLKSALIEAGVEVRMSKAGVELLPGAGFDPAKLEGLL
ncbi:MAG: hypothetical protein VXW43_10430, partial [Pseudomonadota bacterium]|nr:hypothetical protein [Pseudomonadota bacterium]